LPRVGRATVKAFLVCVFALVLAACSRAGRPMVDAAADPAARAQELPPDAASVAARLEACLHFAGEFNGDRSERDREVTAAMDRLRCGVLKEDAAAIRQKYPANQAVQAALGPGSEL
jgi:hypothetical protein